MGIVFLFVGHRGHGSMTGIDAGLVRQTEDARPDGAEKLRAAALRQVGPTHGDHEKEVAHEHAARGREKIGKRTGRVTGGIQNQHILAENFSLARPYSLVIEIDIRCQLADTTGLHGYFLEELVLAAGIHRSVEPVKEFLDPADMINMEMCEVHASEVQPQLVNTMQEAIRLDAHVHDHGFLARTQQVAVGLVRAENECFDGQLAHERVA